MRQVTLDTRERHDVVSSASTETTVLVAVESACVREALVAILSALDGFQVVAEAASGEEAVELARQVRPHLVVIDQELSDSGPWAIQCMQREQLARRIIALGRNYDGVQ